MRGAQARIAPAPRRIRSVLRSVPAAAVPAALPRAVDRDDRRRAGQPGRHHRDPADDQGRHRRAGAAPGSARAVDAGRRGIGGRHLRGGAVVHPALAGRAGDDGCGGRHPQGPLRAPADPADVLPRPVAVRPVAVAGDERPGHHPAAAVVRPGVPAAQHHSDHRRDGDPAGDVLAAGRRRAGVDRADHADGAALRAGVHPAVAAGAGSVRRGGHARRGGGAGRAGGQVVRA